ncbi:MAG: L-seryl-tRNA(Sec) selenium transferase [Chloroflexi bacterium]|nr:L-seryl-tRNA(Sec) selenium transferase [Chloroflexota bacterium]
MKTQYRALPSVDWLLHDSRIQARGAGLSREVMVDIMREELALVRQAIRAGESPPSRETLIERVADRLAGIQRASLRPVINATGVIIHTNLGRVPLSDAALEAVQTISRGYSNLEFYLERGERGSRHAHVESLLCRVTGAEAALAVNNNAAAVLLILSALAPDKEVILSRGQAVEIGGGFRIPDVMRQSGARLVEVGTTNRTYLRDYENAITSDTALLMRVHTSNFRVVGFTRSVELADLVSIGAKYGLPVVDDLGSGSLLPTEDFGLAHEPTVQESLSAGAALVCFSGDKLIGGPQAGIIVGKEELVSHLKRHPLARAVRTDKMTLAALEATLFHYLRDEAVEKIPVWRMIARVVSDIAAQAETWAQELRESGLRALVVDGESAIGGGSLPGETLPTRLVAIDFEGTVEHPSLTVEQVAKHLRLGRPAVVARIEKNHLLLDPRTVLPGQEHELIDALLTAAQVRRN